MRINQYKVTPDFRNPYVETLNYTDDVVRMIAREIHSNEERVRVILDAGKTIFGTIYKYVPLTNEDDGA